MKIRLEAKSGTDIKMKVSLTANQLKENHTYFFEVNQVDLQKYIHDIKKTLESYPIRGNP